MASRNTGVFMTIGLLGPVTLWASDREIDLGSTRERCILAILALTPRTPVSADAFIDRLWGPEPPAKARGDLYSYIARLRRRLRENCSDQMALTRHTGGGYVLDADRDVIDLHLFRLRQRQARSMADSGDIGLAITLLREAEALWYGEPLADLPGDWIARMRQSLEEERRAATLMRIDLELDLGHHADLLGELWRLAAEFPLDEKVAAASMIGLYRSGRSAEALAVYRDVHGRLVEQGLEPGAALADLHQRILRRDPTLSITPAYRLPPGTGQPDTLPRTTGDFVGRVEETRLLTYTKEPGSPGIWLIDGMAGSGKTRLAVHAARTASQQFPDAQLFVSFHSHDPDHQSTDLGAALDELLQALGIPTVGIPASLTERTAMWRSEFARRRAVVVLDDVPGLEAIQPLLPNTGSYLALVTSRRRLDGVCSATVMHLDVLPPADAARLFTQTAQVVQVPGDKAVEQAVRLCGFLPLAIRVAGRRLKGGEPATLTELVEELSILQETPGASSLIGARVESAFNVSYLALSNAQQELFRLLAVHPCPEFTAASASALIGTTHTEANHILNGLADDHLLERRAHGRYAFHDLLRVFAAKQALASDTETEQRQGVGQVLDYYLATASEADLMLYPHRRRRALHTTVPAADSKVSTPEEARAWLEAERASLIQAVRYAAIREWKHHCADLAHVLAGYLAAGGYWDDAVALHQLALQSARNLGDQIRTAQAEVDLAHALQYRGHYDDALTHAQHAATIYHAAGDHRGEAEALDRVGTIHDFRGRFLEALAYYEEAGNLYLAAGDLRGQADAEGHAGIAHACLGRMDMAVDHITKALARYRQVGDRRGEAKTLNNLGEFQRRRGYHRDAMARYQESAEIFAQIGGRQNESLLHHNMGIVQHYKGHYDEALTSYRLALATYRAIGDLRSQAGAFNDIGIVYQAKEQYAEALAHHQKAEQIADQIGEQYELTIALRGIGDAHAGLGNYTAANSEYATARRLARETGDPYQEAKTIARIAEAALQIEGPKAARIHLRQALAIFDQLSVPEAEQIRIRLHVLTSDLP